MSQIINERRVFYHYPEVRYDEAKYIISILSDEDKIEWLGAQLYYRIMERYPSIVAKLTGMLLEMPEEQIVTAITHPIVLLSIEKEALETLKEHGVIPSNFYIIPLPTVNPLNPITRVTEPYIQPHLKTPITHMGTVICPPIYPYYNTPYFQQPYVAPPEPINSSQPKHTKPSRRTKININANAQADLDEVIRSANPDIKHCGFCNANDHYVRESATDPNSPVICPVLLEFACPYCKQKGHTKKNCASLKTRLV
jgi:hypothetical protein